MWKRGAIRISEANYTYLIKVYDIGSQYGIDGGKVSKLTIYRNGETVCNYDRGWDIKPVDKDTEIALQIILMSHN